MDKIGIIGLGLIGGSLAKALNKNNNFEIVAFNRNEEPLISAFEEKVINNYSTEIDETFSDCKVIFICTPVDKICGYVNKLLPFLNEDTIITDAGSTKNNIFKKMNKFENINFIGGHPMAGSEKTGYLASKDYLFENAYYVLTPSYNIDIKKYLYLENIIKIIGAIPLKLNPEEHDYIVSAISHLPHVIASCLVNLINKLDDEDKHMHLLAAGGFKDMTRIASSSPDIWNSICIDNKKEILKVLSFFKDEIDNFEKLLNTDNVYNFFQDSKNYRDGFASSNKAGYYKNYELKVDIIDKPGSIATVATMLSVNGINIKNIGIINNREFENGVMSVSFENQKDMDSGRKLLKEMNYIIYG